MKKKELLEDLQPDNTQACKCDICDHFDLVCMTQSLHPHDFFQIQATMKNAKHQNVTKGKLFFFNSEALKVDELMAALKKKDDDMRAMEERYKMYLEKARDVSKKTLLFVVFVVVFHLIFWKKVKQIANSPPPLSCR